MLLEAGGYDIVGEASDGTSALKVIPDLLPDVVLLDVQLPDISGFEVAKRIQGQRGAPTVILISSRDATDYGRSIERSGAQGFIPKNELSVHTLAVLLEGSP